MKEIWSEKRIRELLRSLDKITGLSGADLPIKFGNAEGQLASFWCRNGGEFRFSRFWFEDPEWAEESAVDVIKHEYAHYMDWIINDNCSHGQTWKECCVRIGANPRRLYSSIRNDYYRNKHTREAEAASRLNKYVAGQRLTHPNYGHGIITLIEKKGTCHIACVDFDKAGIKKLSLDWIDNNCAC